MKTKPKKVRTIRVVAEPTGIEGVKAARFPKRDEVFRGGRSMSTRAISLKAFMRTAPEPDRFIVPEIHLKSVPKRPAKRRAK